MADCFELKIIKQSIDELQRDFNPDGFALKILRINGFRGRNINEIMKEFNNGKCNKVLLTSKDKSEFHSEQAGISVKKNSGLTTKSEYSDIDRMTLHHHKEFSSKYVYGFDKDNKLVKIKADPEAKEYDFVYSGQSQKISQKKSVRNEHFIKCHNDKQGVFMIVQAKKQDFTIIMGYYLICDYRKNDPPIDANPKDKYFPYTFYMKRL